MGERDLTPASETPPPGRERRLGVAAAPGYRDDAHAVVIGINHYSDARIPDLSYAVADAQAFHAVLTDPELGRFKPENVTLLLDADATERRIRSAIGTELPKRAARDHTVCIFFAGHGAPVINPRADSSDGLEKYLLPHDALSHDLRSSGIPMEDVNKFFRWIDTSQVVFFIDSCYSGVAGGRTFGPPDYAVRAAMTDEFLDRLAGEGRLVVTACSSNEVALEEARIGHGLFTHHLIEGLKGQADAGGDGFVTVDELYDYVYRNVEREARERGGCMNPLRKGYVKGTVYLTQYEVPVTRRVREAIAAAKAAVLGGQLGDVRRLWREVLELDAANEEAHAGLAAVEKQIAKEEAERRRDAEANAAKLRERQRRLLEHRKSGDLDMAHYARAMDVLRKDMDELGTDERLWREFTDALIDGGLTISQYLATVDLLVTDTETVGAAPGDRLASPDREVRPPPPRARPTAAVRAPTGIEGQRVVEDGEADPMADVSRSPQSVTAADDQGERPAHPHGSWAEAPGAAAAVDREPRSNVETPARRQPRMRIAFATAEALAGAGLLGMFVDVLPNRLDPAGVGIVIGLLGVGLGTLSHAVESLRNRNVGGSSGGRVLEVLLGAGLIACATMLPQRYAWTSGFVVTAYLVIGCGLILPASTFEDAHRKIRQLIGRPANTPETPS